MALIAVLWMVAALSVMVTGLTRSIRSEARMMSLSRQSVEAQALGDGAIQIALQSIVASNQRITQWAQTEIIYRGVSIEVQAIPLNGLIDINSASLPLLAGLFSVAGGLSPDAAQAASQAVVQARETPDAKGARQRFEAEEDLLRVPGIDYDLYARLAPLLTADVRGSGRVNPLAAPVEVLTVLTGGNHGAALAIAAKRQSGQPGVDTSAVAPAFVELGAVRQLRIQARVPMPDGSVVRVARNVEPGANPLDGAPWQTFRTFHGVEPVQRGNS